MANKLEIDLDTLEKTYQLYCDKYTELDTAFTNLKNAIDTLRNTDWKSAASTQYFSNYDSSWIPDMQRQVEIVEEVRDLLKDAVDTYADIESELSNIAV